MPRQDRGRRRCPRRAASRCSCPGSVRIGGRIRVIGHLLHRHQVRVGWLASPSARGGCRSRRSPRRRAARPGRRARPWTAGARRRAPSIPARTCAERAGDPLLGVHVERGQRVVEDQHLAAWRGSRGPARPAAAARRTAPCPARRSGCRAPTAGRRRTAPAPRSAPPRSPPRVASGAPNVTFSRTLAENSVASSNAQPTARAAARRAGCPARRCRRSAPARRSRPRAGAPAAAASSCPTRWPRRAPASRRAPGSGRRPAAPARLLPG